MTHISKYMAEKIAANIADYRFENSIKDAKKTEQEIGFKLLQEFVDIDFCNSLPKGYLEERTYFYLTTGENHRYTQIEFGAAQPLPHTFAYKTNIISDENQNFIDYKDAEFAYGNLVKDKRKAKEELEKHIFTFKTINKLMREWPEITPFIPEDYKKPKTAIAVPVKALNKRFGLPVESAGAA